ncbi:MAG: hypothetical protein VR73_08325 [Gammaproteobacteria bacterium BRH_c0]|nr:MAG: hypothetical protein VR73_08325 [Gammaproteobacteria bacterium BRH_c0]
MYTVENYIWGLVAYSLGCLLIAPLLWKFSRVALRWTPLRILFGLFVAAFLLTPIKAYQDMDFIAPAWVVAGFEMVRPTTVEGPFRALMPMMAAFLGLVLLYILFVVTRHFARR